MDKVNCDIIQDLLPLYVDDVCSQSSKQAIEIHLESCSNCKDTLKELKRDEIPAQLANEKDKSFKKLATNIRLRKTGLMLICLITALVLLIVGNKIYEHLTFNADVTISFDKVQVLDVCQLSDGRIAFHTLVDDGYEVMGGQYSEGYPYPSFSLRRGYIKIKLIEYRNNMKDNTLNHTYWIFKADQGKIVYVDDKEHVIWEEGDLIPMASEEMEDKLINRRNGAITDYFY